MIETQVQMRFADIDVLGHVNNVNQQHYFDLGKSDFCNQIFGLEPYWTTEGMIIVSTRADYIAQIRMNEPISVQTKVVSVGGKSFTLHHRILNAETRETKTECTVVMVAYNFETQQSIEIPPVWREKLSRELKSEKKD